MRVRLPKFTCDISSVTDTPLSTDRDARSSHIPAMRPRLARSLAWVEGLVDLVAESVGESPLNVVATVIIVINTTTPKTRPIPTSSFSDSVEGLLGDWNRPIDPDSHVISCFIHIRATYSWVRPPQVHWIVQCTVLIVRVARRSVCCTVHTLILLQLRGVAATRVALCFICFLSSCAVCP
jgi:hypothetical protein